MYTRRLFRALVCTVIAGATILGVTVGPPEAAAETPATERPVPPSGAPTRPDSTKHSPTTTERFDDAHRRQLYREGRLRYSEAALWTALFPGLGNFYAKQYFIGALNASLMGFAAVLVPYGLTTSQMPFVWSGVATAGTGYVSGFTTSYFGVRRFNRKLRRGLRVSASPSLEGMNAFQGPVPGVTLNFSF